MHFLLKMLKNSSQLEFFTTALKLLLLHEEFQPKAKYTNHQNILFSKSILLFENYFKVHTNNSGAPQFSNTLIKTSKLIR